MSYEHFAYLYDQLMEEAPYDQWVSFVREKVEKYPLGGNQLLDLACGTGELSVRLAKAGFDVTGIDLSEDMLAVAQAKSETFQTSISFFQQNMVNLEGQGQFDIICIFCDSLNYLSTEEEVIQTFSSVFQHLKPDGLFLFDVHSIFKITQVFANQTYTLNDDDLAYIWNSFPGEFANSVEHELSFFVLDERSGKYDRYDELHFQRTFPTQTYQKWLAEAGFDLVEVCADFENTPPDTQSERIFFVLRKNKKPSL